MSSEAASRFPALGVAARKEGNGEAHGESLPALEETRDELLMALITEGSQQALSCLFERYAKLLRNIGARILRDATEAEDLVQDLFLFIQRKCAVFDSSKSSARSWIVQMAYQRAISRRRYLATRQFYARVEVPGGADHVVGAPTTERDYSPDAVFGRNGLTKAVDALSGDQRETLRLHFFEGYTLTEISEKLGQPLGNVRHHYYRALAKLRKQMFGSSVPVAEPYGK